MGTNPKSAGRYCMCSAPGYPAWHTYEILEPLGIVPNLQKVENPDGAVLTPVVDCSKVQSSDRDGLGIKLIDPAKSLEDMLTSMKTTHDSYLAKSPKTQ